jgi:cyclic-di-GMP-binding biofilm dispersal mediator protein
VTKRVLVVGASGVLGSLVSLKLEKHGVEVVKASRSDIAGHFHIDLRDQDSIKSCVESVGYVDGVLNAAGVVAFGRVTDVPQGVVSALYEINARGVSCLIAETVPFIREGGFFCNVTGAAADMDLVGMSAYCASKAAAAKTLRIVKKELRASNIRVVDARPGHTETGLSSRALFGVAPKMPAGLDPERVAGVLVDGVLGDTHDMPVEYFTTH